MPPLRTLAAQVTSTLTIASDLTVMPGAPTAAGFLGHWITGRLSMSGRPLPRYHQPGSASCQFTPTLAAKRADQRHTRKASADTIVLEPAHDFVKVRNLNLSICLSTDSALGG